MCILVDIYIYLRPVYPGAQWHRCLGLDGGHTDTHSASWLQGRPEQGWAAQLPRPCREVTRGSAGDRRLMRVLCRYVDNIDIIDKWILTV